jgi:hypothetical protein
MNRCPALPATGAATTSFIVVADEAAVGEPIRPEFDFDLCVRSPDVGAAGYRLGRAVCCWPVSGGPG